MSNRIGYLCPECNNRLKVTHVYQAGAVGKTANAVCATCGKRWVLIHAILGEARPRSGASALARKMSNGGVQITIKGGD